MRIRRLVLVLTALLVGGMVGVATARAVPDSHPPFDAQAISVKASAGFNGVYRPGLWMPVYVELTNETSETWEGYVQALVLAPGAQTRTVYRVPVALARKSHKRLAFDVSLERGVQPSLEVELVTRDGKPVATTRVSVQAADTVDVLYAVVTESVYGAVDLTARAPGAGQVYQVNWLPEAFPAHPDVLRALDVILLHDVDVGTWGPEQIAALRSWVLGGGHLIVAGGDAWPRTTARLGDLLPTTPQGVRTLKTAAAFGEYVRRPSAALDEALAVTLSTPNADARVLLASEDVPLIVRGRYGSGWVDFFAADPQAAPFRAWSDFGDLWYMLIVSTGPRPSWVRGFGDWDVALEAARSFRAPPLPTVRQLCGFLALYMLALGPLNYWVLKRLKRMEWAWFTVPAIVLAFSGVAHTVGFDLRGSAPTLNTMAAVRAWPEHQTAQVQGLVGVLSPRQRIYTLTAPPGYMLRALPGHGSGVDAPVAITEGTPFVAEGIRLGGGTAAHFVLDGAGEIPALQTRVAWTLAPDDAPRITGSVTNTTGRMLEDAVLVVKGEARALGTLAPGQTAYFDIQLGPQGAAPLLLGSGDLPHPQVGGAAMAFTQGITWCFYSRGLGVTLLDVMQGAAFPCNTLQDDYGRTIQRRYRLLAAYVVDTETSGGRGDGAYLFAWGGNAPFEAQLDRPPKKEATTLYIFELPVTVRSAEVDAVVHVPPALTYWTQALTNAPSTLHNARPDQSFQLAAGDQAVFQFFPMPRVRLGHVSALDVSWQTQGQVSVELWDWEARRWERIAATAQAAEMHVKEAARFAGPENAVRVRLSAPDALAYNQVTYVGVAYDGTLAMATPPASDE